MDDYRSGVRSAVSPRAAVARRRSACWHASINWLRTCRIASACRRSWRATARPRCARSPSTNGWARARSTRRASSTCCASAAPTSRRSSRGCSSTSARRTASSISVSAQRRRQRRVLAAVLRRAHGRRADGREDRRRHVPPHRGSDFRRHSGGDESARPHAPDASAAARAGRPRTALPLARAHRARRRAAGGDRAHRRACGSRGWRNSSSGAPRRRSTSAAGCPTTPARSIPISVWRTSRSPPRRDRPGVLPAGPSPGARVHDGDRRALGRDRGARDRCAAVHRQRRARG